MINTFNTRVQRKQRIIYAAKLITPIILLIICVVFYYDSFKDFDTVLIIVFLFVYFYFISYSSFKSVLDGSGALKSEFANKFLKSKKYQYVVLLNIKNLKSITIENGFKYGDDLMYDFYHKLDRYITYSYYQVPIVRLWSGYFLLFFKSYKKDILHKIKLFEFEFKKFELDVVGSENCPLDELFDKMHQKKPQDKKPHKIQKIHKTKEASEFFTKKGFNDLEIYSLIGSNNTKEDVKKLHFIKDFIFVPVSLSTLQDNSFYNYAKSLSKNIIFEFCFELPVATDGEDCLNELKKSKNKINQTIQRYQKAGFLIAQNKFFYPYFDIDIAIFDIDFIKNKDEKTSIIFDETISLCKKLGILSMSRFIEKEEGKTELMQGFYYHKAVDFENFKKDYLCLCQN